MPKLCLQCPRCFKFLPTDRSGFCTTDVGKETVTGATYHAECPNCRVAIGAMLGEVVPDDEESQQRSQQ
jgi:hypothetical protein